MIKIIAISILIINSSFANDKIICASYNAFKLRYLVDKLKNDKVKHCTLSCLVAKKCKNDDILVIGAVKEVLDIFGPGNSEWADMKANMLGVHYARTRFTCKTPCKKSYLTN